MSQPARREYGERGGDREARRPSGLLLLPAEARIASSHPPPLLDDPDLVGNPVAVAHARALRPGRSPAASGEHRGATALYLLLVAPAIVLLVSNPLGLVVLFLLCVLFAYFIGFGGAL